MGADHVFRVQLGISVLGLVLSTVMLAAGRDPAIYLPVLTSIIGYWLPAPRRDRVQGVIDTSTQHSVNFVTDAASDDATAAAAGSQPLLEPPLALAQALEGEPRQPPGPQQAQEVQQARADDVNKRD